MGLDVKLLKQPLPSDIDDMGCGENEGFFENNTLYDANITHNLSKMAQEAGVYHHLWRPDEIGITQAKELIEPLATALKDLYENRHHHEKFEAKNGYGTWGGFVDFVRFYLEACSEYPDAYVIASR